MSRLPGYETLDHLGITVPNLDAAVEFFTSVLGAELWYSEGPFSDPDGEEMWEEMRIHPRAVERLAMLKLGAETTIELLEFRLPDGVDETPPPVSNHSVAHLALRVGDIDAAVGHLREAEDVEVLAGPTGVEEGPAQGLRWIYFLAPWGLALELIQLPEGMAV